MVAAEKRLDSKLHDSVGEAVRRAALQDRLGAVEGAVRGLLQVVKSIDGRLQMQHTGSKGDGEHADERRSSAVPCEAAAQGPSSKTQVLLHQPGEREDRPSSR
jgi:hypothetical protein